MKFTCHRDILMKKLSLVQKVITIRSSITILSSVLFEVKDEFLIIKASDVKLRFETKIPVQINSEGKFAIFADKFFDLIKSLPSCDIEFSLTEDILKVCSLERMDLDIQLHCQSGDGFPLVDEPEGSTYFQVLQKDLINMINQTFFAVSKDESRIFMNGIFLKKFHDHLIMVATDGRRLSLIKNHLESKVSDFNGIIIHPKFLTILKSLACGEGEILLLLSEKAIYAQFDEIKISATLIDGQFPNYERVIPETQSYSVDLNRLLFLDCLKRAAIFSDEKTNRIVMRFGKNEIEISCEDSRIGDIKESMACEYDGKEFHMALNHNYLREPLSVMTGDICKFHFTDQNQSITLVSDREDVLHIVMPMQI